MKTFLPFAFFILLLVVSPVYADPEPTPTPMEVYYFEIDTFIVESGLMIFDYSGIEAYGVTLTVYARNDNITTYIVLDVNGDTVTTNVVYQELVKKVPIIKKLKKVKEKTDDQDIDNRSVDIDYKFVHDGVSKE